MGPVGWRLELGALPRIMTDPTQSPLPFEIPPGGIPLGTFNFAGKGPGTYLGGVVKIIGKPDADLLDAANSFLKAADRCLNGNRVEQGVELLIVPGAVCAAFSCELFLKYIVMRETGQAPRRHALDDLFQKCSAQSRDELARECPDILQMLQRNSEQFVEARYHHEEALFSFRQQEMLQIAEMLSRFVRSKFCAEAPNKA